MGIYDRDYYRGSGPSVFGSLDRGAMCKTLIVTTVAVFFLQLLDYRGAFGRKLLVSSYLELNTGAEAFRAELNSEPDEKPEPERRTRGPSRSPGTVSESGVLQGQVWRLLTYAFLHDTSGIMHILFNMLFLWMFGADVEDLLGSREFLAFYLVAAICGGVVYTICQLAGVAGYAPSWGASGAVTAVMVLAALHHPNQVLWLFFVLPVPIWLVIGYEVAKDAFVAISGIDTGTAVTIHLAGAAFAFIYYRYRIRITRLGTMFSDWKRARSKPRLRVYREQPPLEVVAVSKPAKADNDEQLEAKLDAVLEKVSRNGQSSLNEDERQILRRASEIYKKKRT